MQSTGKLRASIKENRSTWEGRNEIQSDQRECHIHQGIIISMRTEKVAGARPDLISDEPQLLVDLTSNLPLRSLTMLNSFPGQKWIESSNETGSEWKEYYKYAEHMRRVREPESPDQPIKRNRRNIHQIPIDAMGNPTTYLRCHADQFSLINKYSLKLTGGPDSYRLTKEMGRRNRNQRYYSS